MINGTKLLNVAGMTRGRRDGILKAEKQKHVVKIGMPFFLHLLLSSQLLVKRKTTHTNFSQGPMHLKGVWIPFEKALEFANKEKITEMLYPLFVHNIGALLYHPSNQTPGGITTRASGVYAPNSLRRESVGMAQQQQGPPPQAMENMRRESVGMSPQDGYKHEPRPPYELEYKQEPSRSYEQEPRGYAQEPRGYEHERAAYEQEQRSPQSAGSEGRMIHEQLHQQQQQQRTVYDPYPVAGA